MLLQLKPIVFVDIDVLYLQRDIQTIVMAIFENPIIWSSNYIIYCIKSQTGKKIWSLLQVNHTAQAKKKTIIRFMFLIRV